MPKRIDDWRLQAFLDDGTVELLKQEVIVDGSDVHPIGRSTGDDILVQISDVQPEIDALVAKIKKVDADKKAAAEKAAAEEAKKEVKKSK